MRPRSGFSLIELLVALLVADVGLLALVAGTAVVIRRQNESRLQATASRAAVNRVERTIAVGCRNVVGATTLPDGMAERWTATVLAGPVREIAETVSYRASEPRSFGIDVRVAC